MENILLTSQLIDVKALFWIMWRYDVDFTSKIYTLHISSNEVLFRCNLKLNHFLYNFFMKEHCLGHKINIIEICLASSKIF